MKIILTFYYPAEHFKMKMHAPGSLTSFYCKLNVMRLLAQLYDFALAFAFSRLVCECKAKLIISYFHLRNAHT